MAHIGKSKTVHIKPRMEEWHSPEKKASFVERLKSGAKKAAGAYEKISEWSGRNINLDYDVAGMGDYDPFGGGSRRTTRKKKAKGKTKGRR